MARVLSLTAENIGDEYANLSTGKHQKSWTSPNTIFGRQPQLGMRGAIRDPSEESWRPGLLVPTSVGLKKSFPDQMRSAGGPRVIPLNRDAKTWARMMKCFFPRDTKQL